MKDYEVLDGMIEKHTEHLKTAYDKGYEQGYEDGIGDKNTDVKSEISDSYNNGMHDAWECIKKLLECKTSELNTLFDTYNIGTVLANFTAQEVMAKIDRNEDNQEICKTCKHDGFICDECENNSMYEPMPNKKYCTESQILEDEYCKYPNLECSECPVKKGKK